MMFSHIDNNMSGMKFPEFNFVFNSQFMDLFEPTAANSTSPCNAGILPQTQPSPCNAGILPHCVCGQDARGTEKCLRGGLVRPINRACHLQGRAISHGQRQV